MRCESFNFHMQAQTHEHSEWCIMMMARWYAIAWKLYTLECVLHNSPYSSKTRYVNRISLVSLFWLAHYAKIALVWSFADKLTTSTTKFHQQSSFETVRDCITWTVMYSTFWKLYKFKRTIHSVLKCMLQCCAELCWTRMICGQMR